MKPRRGGLGVCGASRNPCHRLLALGLFLGALLPLFPQGAEPAILPPASPAPETGGAGSGETGGGGEAPSPAAPEAPFPRPLRGQRESPAAGQPAQPLPSPALPGGRETLAAAYLDRPLVRQYLRQYSSPMGIAWLNGVMNRGEPYLNFIRREVEKRGLPPDLAWLPVIESAYLPTALSGSGAAGLWQFMKNSVAPFDMKIDDWMDERLDFWKSTEGALRKLEDNYRYFGDWPLALAAYNAGLGAVSRVVRDTGIKDYWALSEKKLLKNETIQYVPKLLAVSRILAEPRRYGLEPRWREDPRWTRIPVNRAADLELLAAAAGLDPAALKRANPELRFGVSPPEGGYLLKAPAAAAPALARALEQGDLPLVKYHYHTLRSGDILSALAVRYGVSVAQILAANPGTEERRLLPGAALRIPALGKGPPPAAEPRAGEEKPAPFEGSYRVKPGDTLWSIALAHGTAPEDLAEANGMGLQDILREGRILKTPIKE